MRQGRNRSRTGTTTVSTFGAEDMEILSKDYWTEVLPVTSIVQLGKDADDGAARIVGCSISFIKLCRILKCRRGHVESIGRLEFLMRRIIYAGLCIL